MPHFVGRTAELRLFSRLCDGDLSQRVLHVHGPPGIGKTALLRRFADLAPGITILDDTTTPPPGRAVIASRRAPGPVRRADPQWRANVLGVPLTGLSDAEARELATDDVLEFCRGHPLALLLAAGALARDWRVEVAQVLRELFVQDAPPAAVEAAAHVRVVTEPLLAALLDRDAAEPFDALRRSSVVEVCEDGVALLPVVRHALVTELRWRDPDRQDVLHERARRYYRRQLPRADAPTRRGLLLDYLFLHREAPELNTHLRPLRQFPGEVSTLRPDSARQNDLPLLLDMVVRHEGIASADVAARWFTDQPRSVRVVRAADDAPPLGFLAVVTLEGPTGFDVGADAMWRHLASHAPLRSGETATVARFWLAAESYQDASPVQSVLTAEVTKHFLTAPGLAYTFLVCAAPDSWLGESASYGHLTRLSELDFEVDGRRYGVFGHDWRQVSPAAWLDLVANHAPSPAARRLLDADEFALHVRHALRLLPRAADLLDSPLLRCRFVDERLPAGAGGIARTQALRQALQDAAATLRDSPRDVKFFRALHHTYLQPAGSQEHAAELLRLPSSTFRRHLTTAVRRVTAILWEQELMPRRDPS